MLLFAISTDLGYPILIDSNEKFITLFVRVFTKTDATEPHIYKSS